MPKNSFNSKLKILMFMLKFTTYIYTRFISLITYIISDYRTLVLNDEICEYVRNHS